MISASRSRRLFAEFLGSAFLAMIVIGSGIAAQQLSPGDVGLQLFENAAATAAGLFVIILIFGPVSGGHFNPVVSLVDAAFGGLKWRDAIAYIPAQVAGCIAGAIAANAMFALAAVSISTKHRASVAHIFSEVIATLGLLLVILSLARTRRGNNVLRHLCRHRSGRDSELHRRAVGRRARRHRHLADSVPGHHPR